MRVLPIAEPEPQFVQMGIYVLGVGLRAALNVAVAVGNFGAISGPEQGLVGSAASPFVLHLATQQNLAYLAHTSYEMYIFLCEGSTDTVAQIPSGLVGDSDGALELVDRGTFLGPHNKVNCYKPFPQRKVTTMENGASGNGKPVAT